MKLLFSCICSLLSLVQILGQIDTVHLEDITISAMPFEKRLSETTGSLSIIQTGIEDALHTVQIADLINTVPGVYMSSGTYATNRLIIRGVGSRSPYSSNRIRAYFEEIPLTSGDGISAIEDLDINGIARIEIIKGPASAMYGSGLGGLVKLKARYPSEKGFSYGFTGSQGSFNTSKYGLSAGWNANNLVLSAGYFRAWSDGFRENNRYRRDQLFLHGKTGTQKSHITFHILATDLYAEIPSSLNETDFTNTPEKAASNWLAVKGYESYSKVMGGATWNYSITNTWQNSLSIFSTFQNPYESRPFNILDDQSAQIGIRDFVQFGGKKIKIQSGFELFHETYNWKIFETRLGEQGDLLLINKELRRYANFFTHVAWTPTPKINIESGFNIHRLEYQIHTIYHIDAADQSGSYSYQAIVSPRFGMKYSIMKDLSFHAAVGHGFSAPSLEETLLPEGLINPDLRPEIGWNLDAGFRGFIWGERWYYDLGAYTIFIRNMLVTKRITEDTFTGINAGAVKLTGIEFYNKIKLYKASSAATWKNTIYISAYVNSNHFTEFIDDGIVFSDNALPGIPKQMLSCRYISQYMDKMEFEAEYIYSGRQFMNDANTANYSGHMVTNGKTSYTISPKNMPFSILISAGINNLFNTKYASMILVNANSFGGAAPRYYYPGMPRNVFLAFSVKL